MYWRDESESDLEVSLEGFSELFDTSSYEDSGDFFILVIWLYSDFLQE